MSKEINKETDAIAQAEMLAPPTVDITLDEVDFNELFELEKSARATEEQLNKLSGAIFRLGEDQKMYYNHEKTLNSQLELKRKELLKRYKIDESRKWQIDIKTRKVVYSQ